MGAPERNEAVDPRRLADEVTRPYPAYISFASTLNFHQLIDQLPRDIAVASLDRSGIEHAVRRALR